MPSASTVPKTPIGDVLLSHDLSAFLASSPPVLEPSKDESRRVEVNGNPLLRSLLSRSLDFEPSEATPILPSEQMNGQGEESGTNCCTTAINCYKNSVAKFRNSAFMLILQLIFSSIPISAIVMGVLFAENCPKVSFLPVFGAVIGAIGVIFIALWMYASFGNIYGTPISNRQQLLLGVACLLVLIMTVVDAGFVFCLSPSFDPTSTSYCNETFSNYAFYKEIASAVAVVLSTIIYLPGSRHILCCDDCSMRSPPNAFYYSI
ncbi:unnamed protein product [Larinioides sclopetarius]